MTRGTVEERIQEAQIATLKLYSKFDKVLKDYSILRFYTNGVIKKFTAMINQVLSMWSEVEFDIPGQNLGAIKKMVNQQLDNFRSTMPLECSYDEIRDEVENLLQTMKDKTGEFEKKVVLRLPGEETLEYRSNFNNDLELEINKLIVSGKISRNFLNKLTNEILSPLQTYMNMPSNPMFPGVNLDAFPMVQDMKNVASEFSGLLTDYKFYTTLRDQKESFNEQDFEMNEVVNQLIEKYTSITMEKDIDLFYKIDKTLPEKVHASRVLLEKLMMFLLDNGLNILSISNNLEPAIQEKLTLTVEVVKTENWRSTWRIAVEDSGIGFPTERLTDVYSFFSLYSEKDPFASLKLKMIEEMVDFLGGTLDLVHANGKTSFSVLLGVDLV